MPILSNPRHEAFAQALAKGMSQDAAYAQQGYKPSRHHASRLATNGNVVARVREIQAKVSEKAEWSAVERLELLQSIAMANKDQDPRVTVSAISEANKMCGTLASSKADVNLTGNVAVTFKTVYEAGPTKANG